MKIQEEEGVILVEMDIVLSSLSLVIRVINGLRSGICHLTSSMLVELRIDSSSSIPN